MLYPAYYYANSASTASVLRSYVAQENVRRGAEVFSRKLEAGKYDGRSWLKVRSIA